MSMGHPEEEEEEGAGSSTGYASLEKTGPNTARWRTATMIVSSGPTSTSEAVAGRTTSCLAAKTAITMLLSVITVGKILTGHNPSPMQLWLRHQTLRGENSDKIFINWPFRTRNSYLS